MNLPDYRPPVIPYNRVDYPVGFMGKNRTVTIETTSDCARLSHFLTPPV